jgi:hypothetical protein
MLVLTSILVSVSLSATLIEKWSPCKNIIRLGHDELSWSSDSDLVALDKWAGKGATSEDGASNVAIRSNDFVHNVQRSRRALCAVSPGIQMESGCYSHKRHGYWTRQKAPKVQRRKSLEGKTKERGREEEDRMSIEWSFPFICIMCLGIANMSLGVPSRAWYGCQLKDTHLRTSVTDQARWQWAIHAETIEIKLNMTLHETSVYILELPLMKPGSSNFLLQMRTKGGDY